MRKKRSFRPSSQTGGESFPREQNDERKETSIFIHIRHFEKKNGEGTIVSLEQKGRRYGRQKGKGNVNANPYQREGTPPLSQSWRGAGRKHVSSRKGRKGGGGKAEFLTKRKSSKRLTLAERQRGKQIRVPPPKTKKRKK